MATKGPKSDAKPAAAAKPVPAPTAKAAAKPVVKAPAPVAAPKVAAATAETPKAEAVAPVAVQAAVPAPIPAPVVAAKPVDTATPMPVAAAPAADVTPAKAPVVIKTAPKAAPTPVAATTTTPTAQKETIMENTIKNATDKVQTLFADMNERTKAAVERSTKLFADMNDFNKGNVEALVESSKIATKALETMSQDAAELTRKSFETATATLKSLSSVKSPTEFMKLHSDYVRQSFDTMVAESSKATETMLKVAGEISQPISNRIAVAAEKIKISA